MMAKFNLELPNDLIKQFEKIEKNSEKMIGDMTKAGAEVVYNNVKANVPKSWENSQIMDCLKVTKVYKTPTDDGINTKIAFYGYFINKQGERVPAPLVANVTEYGESKRKKRPFFRKSFKKKDIEEAMIKVQKKYIGE